MTSGRVFSQILFLSALLSTSTGVFAAGSGTIIMNGKTAAVSDAYAYRHATPDKSAMLTTIVLSDRAIDDKRVSGSNDPDKTIHALLKQAKAVYWEAVVGPDGRMRVTNAVWPGVLEIRGGGDPSDLHLTRNDATHIEGSYRSLDEQPKEPIVGGEYFDVKFSIDF